MTDQSEISKLITEWLWEHEFVVDSISNEGSTLRFHKKDKYYLVDIFSPDELKRFYGATGSEWEVDLFLVKTDINEPGKRFGLIYLDTDQISSPDFFENFKDRLTHQVHSKQLWPGARNSG